MRLSATKAFLLSACLGIGSFFIPANCNALDRIDFSNGTSLSMHGFFRNNFGYFFDDQPNEQNGNDLATLRTWFRGYADWTINRKLRFWAGIQFVYEPEYDVERGATSSAEPVQHAGRSKEHKEYSEYDNINDVLREFYVEWKPSARHDIKIGRQIVIWGEALTDRVGDIIHPEDKRFTLAFSNLEDTRIPSWMIRGIHMIGRTSFFEWIYNPNLMQNMYTVNRFGTNSTNGNPGQRFGIYPETENRGLRSFQIPFTDIVLANPLQRAIFDGFPPRVKEEYPSGWWDDARGGFRTNTMLGGYSFGVCYFHTQNYDPILEYKGNGYIEIDHPNLDIFGFYMNKDLSVIPGVLRTEAIYIPNKPFNTFDMTELDAVTREDYVKYLVAYDLTSALYFQWKKDAAFDVVLEHVGEWIPNNDDLQYASFYTTEHKRWNPSYNLRVATTWRYGQLQTEIITSYIPWGHSGLFMPFVKYTWPWFDQRLTFELRYINVFGNDRNKGLGIMDTKDMLVFTTEFNW